MLFCSVASGKSHFSLCQLPKRSTLTVVHTDVSTTAVSDQAFIPVSRRSINETNAPTICTSPRIKRTIAHARLSLACVGEGGCRSGTGPPKALSRGDRYPSRSRGGHAHHDRSLRLARLVEAIHGAHRAGDHLWWQTDEAEGFVEGLALGEAPRDVCFEGSTLLRVVIRLI